MASEDDSLNRYFLPEKVMKHQLNWTASCSARPLEGQLTVPGDKSVSHRAIMLASLAEGVSEVDGFLNGADANATAAVFRQCGVRIEGEGTRRTVHGVGLHGLQPPTSALDCGNAGTGMRLLAGVFSGQSFPSTLVGDESLSKRPMLRVVNPLREMGANIQAQADGTPPLHIQPVSALRGQHFSPSIASAQLKSCLLLAGLYAEGDTSVQEVTPTRDYTESMLQRFGADIEYSPGKALVRSGKPLRAQHITVPADVSSAAFFMVAASIVPKSHLVLNKVGINPRRTGIIEALKLMGADIEVQPCHQQGEEPLADIVVRASQLRGIDLPARLVPDMIDEIPVFMIAAAVAEGTTRITGAEELRVKESDRLAAMSQGLKALGARIHETDDGAVIEGGTLQGGSVDSLGDHRIAMAFAVAGQVAESEVTIQDCANVATSFPGFMNLAQSVGMSIHTQGKPT